MVELGIKAHIRECERSGKDGHCHGYAQEQELANRETFILCICR